MEYAPQMMQMVGSGISAYSQLQGGKAEQAAYNLNAEVALQKMKADERTSEAHYSALMGRQRSLYAKAGVDISSGSPLLVLTETAMQGAEEQQSIKNAGQMTADMQRYYGSVAYDSAKTGAMSTFLTGLGKSGMDIWKKKHVGEIYAS